MTHKHLKLALLEHRDPQYVIAQKAGMSETRLSRIVQGRLTPTAQEKAVLKEILGEGLFDSSESREASS